MNTCADNTIEMAGAYVLDALEPDDAEAFETHLVDCVACQAEVAELMLVVDVLPLAVEVVEPPERLRARILAEVRGDELAGPRLTALSGGLERPQSTERRRSRWRARESWLAAVAAVIIVGLGIGNIALIQRNNTNGQPSQQAALLDALKNGATVSPVGRTAYAPVADADIVQPRRGAPAFLLVKNLPANAQNKVYEVWLMRGTKPYRAGVFTYSGQDWKIVRLPISANGYTATAVTNEPSPNGSAAPTGPQDLLGKVGA